MFEFFTGWKRKAGCVTLGLACLFMAGWVRSLVTLDLIEIPLVGAAGASIESSNGGIFFCRYLNGAISFTPDWITGQVADFSDRDDPWFHFDVDWRIDAAGFSLGAGHNGGFDCHGVRVPYWSVIAPLAVLSAYLLFSRPQPAKHSSESS